MGIGKGYGKVILFGEHFVVHGAPAFAAAISSVETVETKKAPAEKFITDKTIIEAFTHKALELITKSMKIEGHFEIKIGGDLPTYGGLGSSAAFSVALVRALGQDFKLDLTNEEVNTHAYAGEAAFHGNPSGIDNTIATYGGAIEFRRGKTNQESTFEFIKLGKELNLIVSFSGKYGPTSEMVSKVKEFREKNEVKFHELMEEYLDISMRGRRALENAHIDELGKLMDLNHALLSRFGVCDDANEKIVKAAKQAGALGAKLTGGGGGGCCISLANDKEQAEKICAAINAAGFKSFCTQIHGSKSD